LKLAFGFGKYSNRYFAKRCAQLFVFGNRQNSSNALFGIILLEKTVFFFSSGTAVSSVMHKGSHQEIGRTMTVKHLEIKPATF